MCRRSLVKVTGVIQFVAKLPLFFPTLFTGPRVYFAGLMVRAVYK